LLSANGSYVKFTQQNIVVQILDFTSSVNHWNSLFQKDIDATTLNSFKSQLIVPYL